MTKGYSQQQILNSYWKCTHKSVEVYTHTFLIEKEMKRCQFKKKLLMIFSIFVQEKKKLSSSQSFLLVRPKLCYL